MESRSYLPVTLSGKRERYYVGRASVDGKKVSTCFEVTTEHEAKVTADRLNFAQKWAGDLDGTAITAPTVVTDEQRQKFKDDINRFRNPDEKIE